MSAPEMPPDNSMQIRQMELDSQKEQQAKEDAAAAARKTELQGMRSSALTSGRSSAMDYLNQQGIDAGAHSGDVESKINSILAGISPDDPNPGSYFNDVGSSVYSALQSGQRAKAGRSLDSIFSPDFETKRLPFTVDDPYLSGVEAEQRSSAEEIIRNMLDRGVINTSGYSAAEADLDKQSAGVKSRLNEIGTGLIGSGQQSLRDVANSGRQAASNLNVDQAFDPYGYSSEADRLTQEFLSTLGTQIRSRVTGNLFSTAGLGALAGAAQGAGNTAFNPNAAAGIIDDEDDPNNPNKNKLSPVF